MCGIAGIINQIGLPAEPALLWRMTDRMHHRGPDATGVFVEGHVALGHRRLAIIDLSAVANQPMSDASGRYRIVFNGEIYNYRQVKTALKTYDFQTSSDTEVILAAYIQWGVGCLQQLNGMFAFAIWDRQEQRLFLARDRVGKKPLYYYQNDQTFLFASEVRALLSTELIPRRLRPEALADYLKYQTVSAPDTLIEGVFQLPAGHYALVRNGQIELHLYWTLLQPTQRFEKEGLTTARQQVRSLLQAAVERRLVSDVPLGVFLSGGIDSSAIVALMAEQCEQPIDTFSINFQEQKYNESVYSDLIAKRFNTRHTAFQLNATDFLNELPAVLGDQDMPSCDGSNTYVVSKLTRQAGVTVALSGLGGDELFAGYETFKRYTQLLHINWFWRLPMAVRSSMTGLFRIGVSRRQTGKLAELIRLADLTPEHVFPLFRQSMSPVLIGQLLDKLSVKKDQLQSFFADNQNDIKGLPLLSQVSVGELMTYTEPLLLRDADQMSMAHSLELRVPFLDYELIEYVLQIPDSIKYPHSPKQLLVESLHPLLPDAIVNRPKMGFSFPWEIWLKNELRPFCENRLHQLAQRDLFNGPLLLRLWQQFVRGDSRVSWNQIWLLVVLEDWLKANGF